MLLQVHVGQWHRPPLESDAQEGHGREDGRPASPSEKAPVASRLKMPSDRYALLHKNLWCARALDVSTNPDVLVKLDAHCSGDDGVSLQWMASTRDDRGRNFSLLRPSNLQRLLAKTRESILIHSLRVKVPCFSSQTR